MVREKPKGSMGESLGCTHPHVLDCRTPSTTAPSPAADSAAPSPSRCGARPARTASPIRRLIARITSTTIRQVNSVVAHPPRIGPMAIPAPATPPMTA